MEFEACPVCGSKDLKIQTESEIFEYKGREKTIEGCEKIVCENCEEDFFTDATSKNNEKIIRDFHREVDGLLTSNEISQIRISMGFTQKTFGELLGGGPKAFAKYESCTLTQSRAMDNLIRLISVFPEALDVLREVKANENRSFKTLSMTYSSKSDLKKKPDYNVRYVSFRSDHSKLSCEGMEDKSISVGAA